MAEPVTGPTGLTDQKIPSRVQEEPRRHLSPEEKKVDACNRPSSTVEDDSTFESKTAESKTAEQGQELRCLLPTPEKMVEAFQKMPPCIRHNAISETVRVWQGMLDASQNKYIEHLHFDAKQTFKFDGLGHISNFWGVAVGPWFWIDSTCHELRSALFAANEVIRDKGGQVHRIFALSQDEQQDPAVRKVLTKQVNAGFHVYVIDRPNTKYPPPDFFLVEYKSRGQVDFVVKLNSRRENDPAEVSWSESKVFWDSETGRSYKARWNELRDNQEEWKPQEQVPKPSVVRPFQIFLCHPGSVKPLASAFYFLLCCLGYDCFLDVVSAQLGQNLYDDIMSVVDSVQLGIIIVDEPGEWAIKYWPRTEAKKLLERGSASVLPIYLSQKAFDRSKRLEGRLPKINGFVFQKPLTDILYDSLPHLLRVFEERKMRPKMAPERAAPRSPAGQQAIVSLARSAMVRTWTDPSHDSMMATLRQEAVTLLDKFEPQYPIQPARRRANSARDLVEAPYLQCPSLQLQSSTSWTRIFGACAVLAAAVFFARKRP